MQGRDRNKLLFIFPKRASFINSDIEVLSSAFDVDLSNYNWTNKILLPFNLIRQFFSLIFKARSYTCIVVSFGGYWSLLPAMIGKWFKRPVYIILHGTDCVRLDEYKYGNMRKPVLRWFLKVSYRKATCLLPVSESLMYTENNYINSSRTYKQGVKYFFKSNQTPYKVIHNALNSEFWCINNTSKRHPNRCLTVLSKGQFEIKGANLILKAASNMPDYEFYIIGAEKPESVEKAPSNIFFIARQTPEELRSHYNSAQFYLQLSLTEGFGCALTEAMSCGCTPIVSNVNMLPEITGGHGAVLNQRDELKLEQLIRSLPVISANTGARRFVIERYDQSIRKEQLLLALMPQSILK